ncbi:MAG TPA: heavy metal translocating P-type ATPase metal-binding domain-containing protein [Flavihumibacter sp.]
MVSPAAAALVASFAKNPIDLSTITQQETTCFHCGETCQETVLTLDSKPFCCEGCKMVYQLLNQHGLCDYYDLNKNPGQNQRIRVRKDKFAFLEDPAIEQQLIHFKDDVQTHVNFYLPHIHCSSCLYLLENLHQLNSGIVKGSVNFTRKEVDIVFHHKKVSLREVAELLAGIGYEPYISLQNLNKPKPRLPRTLVYQLGVAGFCFGNIMLMSFPEYLGLEKADEHLQYAFRYLNFILALPVLLFSAQPFYESAWKSLKHKFLNIDAPIVLAIWVTWVRSVVEVVTDTGGGYFDSFAGIVFFMLIGRVLQDKTYQQLSFERDYTSYFPIAVTVLKGEEEIPTALPNIKAGDTLLIHQDELIPADGILTKGRAYIDYSFVTGESLPVLKEVGEIIYAGGKQTAGNIEVLTVKEVAQSYLTRLWNQNEKIPAEGKGVSFVHLLSRYFTYIVFTISALTALWWGFHDPSKIWPTVTAILIIACPCALLLSNTFTNGHVLRIFTRNGLYLRNAQAIEEMAAVDQIVFDKTGTLTTTAKHAVEYEGEPLSDAEEQAIASLAAGSRHPLSRALAKHLGRTRVPVEQYRERVGKGVEGYVNGVMYAIGSKSFVSGMKNTDQGTHVYVAVDGKLKGYFRFQNFFRDEVDNLLRRIKSNYELAVISGDNEAERQRLESLAGKGTTLLFHQQPQDKRRYIEEQKARGKKVMMVGDGLNDAIALQESNMGIAIAEQSNTFTPASDGILDANSLTRLDRFLRLARGNKQVVMASFAMSIIYNMIGLFFAVQGELSPLICAILMPSSSLSIILLTYGATGLLAKKLKL